MKSKLFRILGVVAVVAMIAASLVAPVSATVTGVTASTTTAGGIISTTGNYTIYATLASQLAGTTSGTITLPYATDTVTFKDATTGTYFGDQVLVTNITVGGVAATAGNTPTWANGGTGSTFTVTTASIAGVVSFTAINGVETVTAAAANTVISYTKTYGNATIAAGTDLNTTMAPSVSASALSMPAAAETVTFVSTASGDKVTMSNSTNWTASFNGTGTGGGITATVITFGTAIGQIATLTSTGAVSATVTLTGSPTFLAGTNAYPTAISITGTLSADTITVTFPSTFTVTTGTPTATIAASTGWYTVPGTTTPVFLNSVLNSTSWLGSATAFTETFTLAQGDYIGANSQVLINITNGVTNPGTAGNYTLTVQTSKETTAVTSNAFAISNPTPTPVAGIASVYNTATTPVLINNYISLDLALKGAAAVSGGATIKLTAGTYTDAVGSYGTAGTSVITIQGTDPSAANVIIKSTGAWTLTGKTIVVDSVTINGKTGTATVVGSSAATVSNSNITTGALTIGATGTGTSNVTKDTFTVATGATGLTPTSATTVTGSTFTVSGTGWGISTANDVTVSGSTFTGATNTTDQYLGDGINVTGISTTGSTIGTSTFTGLSNALTVSGGTTVVNFNGNTVTNCGFNPATGTQSAAIIVTNAAVNGVTISGNTITNGAYYILQSAGYNFQNVSDNTFTGNAKSIKSTDTANTLVAARNWWGSAANVPANVTLVAGTTAGLTFTPALGGAPGASGFATTAFGTVANPIAASATVGVNVTSAVTTAAGVMGASALAANPVAVAIPSTYTAVKYWDVYGTNITGATIDFYGTTAAPITANSAILFYNATTGTWVNAGGTANVFGNYFEIYVGTVTGQTPVMTAAQFNGTPFVLVTIPTVLGTVGPATYPTNGATSVPVSPTNVTFTWPVVTPPAGMTVSYQFALAQASANTTANEFAILDYSDNTITNAEPLQETLQPNTVYWWEVRAVNLNSSGAVAATGPWTVSMFTTAAAPVTTTGGTGTVVTTVVTSVVITNPVTTVVSTSTNIVLPSNTGTSSPAIPSYLLWAVIAVGAVLIIAVIVLIVRTRRIP